MADATTEELERLRSQLETQRSTYERLQKTISGTDRHLAVAGQSLGRTLTDVGSGIDNLTKGVSNSTNALSNMAAAAGMGGAAGAINLMGTAVNASLQQTNRLNQTYSALSQSGAALGEDLGELMHRGSAFGLAIGASEEQARKYVKVITENSTVLARFGGTATEGRRKFEESFQAQDAYRQSLMNLGFSIEDQMEGMADYMRLQTNLGNAQNMTQEQLARGSANYLRELNGLAQITGASVAEQKKAREAALQHAQFQAQMELMQIQGAGKQAAEIQKFESMISSLGPETQGFAKGLRGLTTGTLSLEEAQQLQRATGGEATKIIEQLKNGQIDAMQASEQLAASMNRQRDVNRQMYAVNQNAEQVAGSYMGQRKIIDALSNAQTKGQKVFEQQTAAAEDERSQRAQLNKITTESIGVTLEAQKALQQVAGPALQVASGLTKLQGAIMPGLVDAIGSTVNLVSQYTNRQISGQDFLKGMGQTAANLPQGVMQRMQGGGGGGGGAGPGPGPGPAPLRGPVAPELQNRLNQLNIKPGANAGPVQEQLVALAEKISRAIPGARFTALNDAYHQDFNSLHNQGRALDFTVNPPPRDAAAAVELKKKILGMGAKNVLDEYFTEKSPNWTGGHFHVSMAQGGIASGPTSGYPALLHGIEAVVPLSGNRKIPVELSASSINQLAPPMNMAAKTPAELAKSISQLLPPLSSAMKSPMELGTNSLAQLKIPEMRRPDSGIAEQLKQTTTQQQQQLMSGLQQMMSEMRNNMGNNQQGMDQNFSKIMGDLLSVNRNQQETMTKLLQVSRN